MRDRRPRLDFTAYTGAVAALLTFCTHGRLERFTSDERVDRVLQQFLRAATETHIAILAYCFMPDHVHLVVQAIDDFGDVARFARLAKQYSAYYEMRARGERLWQPSWHDRMIRRSDDLAAIVRYVLNNPVRAGLVESAQDYRSLGSGMMSREELLESLRS